MRPRIVFGGSLAQKPGKGGHTWVFLQYLLGLRRLGWDVLFLDRLDEDMTVQGAHPSASIKDHPGIEYVRRVFDAFGLGDSYGISLGPDEWVGVDRRRALEFIGSSVGFVNVMGFIEDEELLGRAPWRAFLDIDPGFPQIWAAQGLHDAFVGHDRFVTIGQRLGDPDCPVPECGHTWIRTPQPVVLEEWPSLPISGGAFTSIASWRGNMAPLEFQGRRLGLRVHEFRRFFELPQRTGQRFELALDIHPAEIADLGRLSEHGWHLVDPLAAAGDPWRYRDFVQQSAAELMVAKNLYVDTNVGWFSDRSICYLATGRPVLAQNTGLSADIPTGLGLLTFDDLDEAVAGVDAIATDPAKHGRSARAVAEAHFDSDAVLTRLIDRLTAEVPAGASV